MRFSTKRHSSLGIFLLSGTVVALLFGVAGAAQANTLSIAVHWSSYEYNGDSSIPASTSDGIALPDGNYNAYWTNISADWYGLDGSNNVNLPDNTGTPTTATVTCTAVNNAGTNWWVNGPAAGVDNLLEGPWGGNGGGGNGAAIPNTITGIPYSTYEIIAYLNPPYSGTYSAWLDSNPANANQNNAPVAGSQYYFSPDNGSGSGLGLSGQYDLMTNNTDPTTYPAQNTVVWTGLTGSNQVLWTEGWGPNPGANDGFTGFEIVNTPAGTPEPSTLALLTAGATGLVGLAWRKRRTA